MGKKSGLGPHGKQTLSDAAAGKVDGTHPIVSAVLFADATKRFGGASMNVVSGDVYQGGKDAVYMVGQHPDKRGKNIPTKYYGKGASNPSIGLKDVLTQRRRVRRLTGGDRSAVLGSWVDETAPKDGVQIDASTVFHTGTEAVQAMEKRGETALWDNASMTSVYNKNKRRDS